MLILLLVADCISDTIHVPSTQTARDQVMNLEDHQDIGWLRVDMRPIKHALSTHASKWIWTFTKYLSDQVCYSLALQEEENIDFIHVCELKQRPLMEGFSEGWSNDITGIQTSVLFINMTYHSTELVISEWFPLLAHIINDSPVQLQGQGTNYPLQCTNVRVLTSLRLQSRHIFSQIIIFNNRRS